MMTHYTCIVCLPPGSLVDLEDKIAAALAPFDEELKMPEYREYLDDDELENARKYYLKAGKTWTDTANSVSILTDYSGEKIGEDNGRYYRLSTYNPRSKWDWYQIGGRWSGYFQARPTADERNLINRKFGNTCDGGLKDEMDFEEMRQDPKRCKEYGPAGAVPGWCLLTLDGDWMSPGWMGWWATSDESVASRNEYLRKANNYLDQLSADNVVVCVDLHI